MTQEKSIQSTNISCSVSCTGLGAGGAMMSLPSWNVPSCKEVNRWFQDQVIGGVDGAGDGNSQSGLPGRGEVAVY